MSSGDRSQGGSQSGAGRGSLLRLLGLRQIREEQARLALAKAARAARESQREVRSRQAEYASREALPTVLTPAVLRGLMLQGIASHELVEKAIEVYDASLGTLDETRGLWATASSELKSAEKLERRRRLEAERVARVAAEKALDELVLTLRSLQQWT